MNTDASSGVVQGSRRQLLHSSGTETACLVDANTSGIVATEALTATSKQEYDSQATKVTFRNFYLMSILLSVVPAASIACLSIATAQFGSLGAWQSGTLYLSYTLSAMIGSTFVVKRLGSRAAMVLGMTLYDMYVGCFWLVASDRVPLVTKKPIALTGAVIGGIGAGIMWTSQGVYFSQAAEAYARVSNIPGTDCTSTLAGIFACVFLIEETTLNLLNTVLIRGFGISWSVVFQIYSVLAVSATMGMNFVISYDLVDEEGIGRNDHTCLFSDTVSRATTALQLLVSDSRMKYMIGLNAAFGFAGGFLNSVVSGEVVPVVLHDVEGTYIGLLVAIHGLVAAVCSLLFCKLSHFVGKEPVLVVGSVTFALVAIPFLLQPDLTRWNWVYVVAVYAVDGVGRATFEGTLKAVFADYFAYEKEGAFANIILQNGLASSIACVLSFKLTCSEPSHRYCLQYRDGSSHNILIFGLLIVFTSVFAIIGLWRASWLSKSLIAYHSAPLHITPSVNVQKRLSPSDAFELVSPKLEHMTHRRYSVCNTDTAHTNLRTLQI